MAPRGPTDSHLTATSTIATLDRMAVERFEHFGDLLSEAAILLIRPAAMLVSLLRTTLPARERCVAAWFGPKGFASVVYGLLVLQAGISTGDHIFDLVAITIALSIVLHSSTDVPIAKALRVEPPDNLPTGAPDPPTTQEAS